MPAPPRHFSSFHASSTSVRHAALRFALGCGLWTACAGPDPASWVLGLPAAALFTWTGMRGWNPAHPLRFRALPAFFLYFLSQSFRTGLDVARRALHPTHEVHPGYCAYPARLPEGTPQAVFANMISLLPGTLSWSVEDGWHQVHLLSGHPLILEDLAKLESRVGKLFGLDLPAELF